MDKSALKKAYKEAKLPMGIYKIATTRNATTYLGFSHNLPAMINRHRAQMRFGSQRITELQDIWNVFGESSIVIEVFDVLEHKENVHTNATEELRVLLEMWIFKLEQAGHFTVPLQAKGPMANSSGKR